MKPLFISVLISFFFVFQGNSQNDALDTWTIGLGPTYSIMHGDLTSLNSIDNKPLNLGFYIYINKMISPAFGFELKGQILKMRGATQELSSAYPVLFTDQHTNLYFEGDTFGGELNAVLNLNGLARNPYERANRKINFSAYLGIGYHSYNSKLFDLETDNLLIDFENVPGRDGEAKSIYYNTGLGIRYKLTSKFDLELRQNVSFNNEDNLDAAISQHQSFETFFTTNLGLVFKLNRKGSESIVWQNTKAEETIVEEPEEPEINLKDSDGDGVIDQFDKDPNTPKGALTYGNGIAIDTDRDGIIDFYDKCPLEFGDKKLGGCPIIVETDTDGDGVLDKDDLCPGIIGPIDNQGCPVSTNTITEIEKTEIINLAKNIYFPSGKSYLIDSSKKELEKISNIMKLHNEIKFIIEGHTDSGGKRIYNLTLSQERANAVKKYLTQLGVDETNLKAIGYGFSRPKYTNTTSGGRQLNRRVEIKVRDDDSSIGNSPNINYTEVAEATYTIKREDTLYSIAKRFNVTVEQLKRWNNLKNNNIVIGYKLIVNE